MTNNISAGDIIVFASEPTITTVEARHYFNYKTNKGVLLKTYSIEGVHPVTPFAYGLLKQKLICVSRTSASKNMLSFKVFNNYKKNFIDKITYIGDNNLFRKIDAVWDTKILYKYISIDIPMSSLYSRQDNLGYDEQRAFANKNSICFKYDDLGVAYAKAFVANLYCTVCGKPLIDNSIKLIHYSELKTTYIKEKIHAYSRADKIILFPMAYKCKCGCTTVFFLVDYPTGNYFHSFVFDDTKNVIKET